MSWWKIEEKGTKRGVVIYSFDWKLFGILLPIAFIAIVVAVFD